jgi:hypothetical protein
MHICECLLQLLQKGGLRVCRCAPLTHCHAPGRFRFKSPHDPLRTQDPLRMLRQPFQNLHRRIAPCYMHNVSLTIKPCDLFPADFPLPNCFTVSSVSFVRPTSYISC